MKKNTVKITLKEYNFLRDFKKAIERGDTVMIKRTYPDTIYIVDETKQELHNRIDILKKMEYRHLEELYNLEEEFKNMSLRQFLKWRKERIKLQK